MAERINGSGSTPSIQARQELGRDRVQDSPGQAPHYSQFNPDQNLDVVELSGRQGQGADTAAFGDLGLNATERQWEQAKELKDLQAMFQELKAKTWSKLFGS